MFAIIEPNGDVSGFGIKKYEDAERLTDFNGSLVVEYTKITDEVSHTVEATQWYNTNGECKLTVTGTNARCAVEMFAAALVVEAKYERGEL